MTLSWLTVIVVLICAVLFAVVLVLIIRYIRGAEADKHMRLPGVPAESVDVTVYAYDPEVKGLDDIKAKHIAIYRDTGVITDMEDDCRVYRESFPQTQDNDRELGLIVRSAAEVKRVTDKTIIYFFDRIRPMHIQSNKIRVLYDCISQGLDSNRPVVLSMTKSDAGDNEQWANIK